MQATRKLLAARPLQISSAPGIDMTAREVADCARGASHIPPEYSRHDNRRFPVLALSGIPESPPPCALSVAGYARPYDVRAELQEPSEHKSVFPPAPASPDHGS